jgi:hypothetical protein
MPRLCRTATEVIEALLARQDELDISNGTIEGITGLPENYLTKIFASRPSKTLSAAALRDLMEALALGVVAIVLVPDAAQEKRMRRRWTRRARQPTRRRTAGAFLNITMQCSLPLEEPRRGDVETGRSGSETATGADTGGAARQAGGRGGSRGPALVGSCAQDPR